MGDEATEKKKYLHWKIGREEKWSNLSDRSDVIIAPWNLNYLSLLDLAFKLMIYK